MSTADTALDVAIGAAGAAGVLLLFTLYLWLQVRRINPRDTKSVRRCAEW